jgi:ubiquinone/menaquinone biosynthesis C-methylase UbiE
MKLVDQTIPFVKMSSALSPGPNKLAEKYSQLNEYQMIIGKDFFSSLNKEHGGCLRVLDMGCGTGELTAFIADTVGDNSDVVGVDPISDRINIALNKNYRENLTFIHGDSSSQFPHYNEAYYDLHFSNFVIQWLNPREKEMFISTAFRILKAGGRLAVHSLEEQSEILATALDLLLNDGITKSKLPVAEYFVNRAEFEKMLKRAGFDIISSENKPASYKFENLDHFLNWIRATYYISESKLCGRKMEEFLQRFASQDGTVTISEPTVYQIIAVKPE